MILKTYGLAFAVTIVGLIGAVLYGGTEALILVAILGVLEVSLSFDNAVVNAGVLERMSHFWQRIFLTVGILIAVFGMRLVFPFVIVAITAKLGPIEAVNLALEKGNPDEPGTYGYILNQAHPSIAGFGGAFLLMIFLNWLFDDKERTWLSFLEKPLAKLGAVEGMSVIVALGFLGIAAMTFAADEAKQVLLAGAFGIVTYLLVNGLGELFNPEGGTGKAVGKAAFFLFLYIEVLDASFSFDGVIGAFAVTADPILIAIGLGIGAMYVRSLTVHMVEAGTLNTYPFLEHGAMWAIGALASILFISVHTEVPEVITGLVGVGFIAAAIISSVIYKRRHPEEDTSVKLHADADQDELSEASA
jgi:hypothetical protein